MPDTPNTCSFLFLYEKSFYFKFVLCLIFIYFIIPANKVTANSSTYHLKKSLYKKDNNNPLKLAIGLKIRYFYDCKRTGGSNFSLSGAAGIHRSFGDKNMRFIPSYQLACNVYFNGLGNNMLGRYKKTQIDLVNSFFVTGGWGYDEDGPLIELKTFNSMTENAIHYPFNTSLSVGSNIILNNHRRNQQVGAAYVNIYKGMFRLAYFNDATPWGKAGLADGSDRWWTGGLHVEFNLNNIIDMDSSWQDYTPLISYSFERFTADLQDAYVMSKMLSLDYIPNTDEQKNFYNRGQQIISLGFIKGSRINFTKLGNYYSDFQDLSHNLMGFSRFYSISSQKSLIGIESNHFFVNQNID